MPLLVVSSYSNHKVYLFNRIYLQVNIILRYLERSKTAEIDVDGNVIWIREHENNQVAFSHRATFSPEFIEYIETNNIDLSAKD